MRAVLNSCNALVYGAVGYGFGGLRAGSVYVWRTLLILILSHLSLVQVGGYGMVGLMDAAAGQGRRGTKQQHKPCRASIARSGPRRSACH